MKTKDGAALQYTDANHKHAVTSGGGNMYQYDTNGNMTKRVIASGPLAGTYALGYDAENRLVKVCQDTNSNAVCDVGETNIASFVYDGDGRRVQAAVNGVTTTFVGSYYEVTGSTVTKYYYAGTQRIAMRVSGTLHYLLSDHLGSTSITTDASATVVSELRYKPWGEVRYALGTTPTEYTFTGQYSDSYINLLWYGSRHYDPYLNHMTQPDTIVPDPANPQDWNRYSYARYNPLRYTDPTGHRVDEGCGTADPTCGDLPDPEKNKKDRDDGPIVLILPNNVSIIIMPIGFSPSPYYRTAEQLALAQYLTEWGVALDELELAAVLAQFDTVFLDNILSGGDVGVTYGSCINSGECYYGQPHPELPNMLVLNQDALLTTSDLVAPILGGIIAAAPTSGVGFIPGSQIVDALTTSMSLIYDTTRWTGDTPNFVSFGIDSSLNLNIIFYR